MAVLEQESLAKISHFIPLFEAIECVEIMSATTLSSHCIILQGLDTAAPRLKLADGSWVVGHYESTIGSTLVLADETQQVADGQTGTVRYICHTERRLVFRK